MLSALQATMLSALKVSSYRLGYRRLFDEGIQMPESLGEVELLKEY